MYALASGDPQGSVLGPLLFAMYVSEICDVIHFHAAQYHQYADDLVIYLSLVPSAFGDLSSLVDCSDAVSAWFLRNALLLNPDKTKAVLFGTRQRLSSLNTGVGVRVAGSVIQFTDAAKLLGVTLDSTVTFDQHTTNVVRACTYHMHALRHIRPLLTTDATKTIASAIIGARLDYCNSLLYGSSARNLDRLQKVQNQLTRVVLQLPWSASATDARLQLHWLLVTQRIVFKIASITYRARPSL